MLDNDNGKKKEKKKTMESKENVEETPVLKQLVAPVKFRKVYKLSVKFSEISNIEISRTFI